jgi:hypothetical protein
MRILPLSNSSNPEASLAYIVAQTDRTHQAPLVVDEIPMTFGVGADGLPSVRLDWIHRYARSGRKGRSWAISDTVNAEKRTFSA